MSRVFTSSGWQLGASRRRPQIQLPLEPRERLARLFIAVGTVGLILSATLLVIR